MHEIVKSWKCMCQELGMTLFSVAPEMKASGQFTLEISKLDQNPADLQTKTALSEYLVSLRGLHDPAEGQDCRNLIAFMLPKMIYIYASPLVLSIDII
jgi:hypothetical protein